MHSASAGTDPGQARDGDVQLGEAVSQTECEWQGPVGADDETLVCPRPRRQSRRLQVAAKVRGSRKGWYVSRPLSRGPVGGGDAPARQRIREASGFNLEKARVPAPRVASSSDRGVTVQADPQVLQVGKVFKVGADPEAVWVKGGAIRTQRQQVSTPVRMPLGSQGEEPSNLGIPGAPRPASSLAHRDVGRPKRREDRLGADSQTRGHRSRRPFVGDIFLDEDVTEQPIVRVSWDRSRAAAGPANRNAVRPERCGGTGDPDPQMRSHRFDGAPLGDVLVDEQTPEQRLVGVQGGASGRAIPPRPRGRWELEEIPLSHGVARPTPRRDRLDRRLLEGVLEFEVLGRDVEVHSCQLEEDPGDRGASRGRGAGGGGSGYELCQEPPHPLVDVVAYPPNRRK